MTSSTDVTANGLVNSASAPAVRRQRPPLSALLAWGWLAVVIIAGALAGVLAPYEETEQDLWSALEGPSWGHPLGTDVLGRDVLSRLMYGAPETLIGVATAIVVFVLFGVASGLLSGYFAGNVDRILSAIVHIVISTPVVIILFVVLSVFRDNTFIAMLVFGALSSPVMALVVRSATLSIRRELFVDAAKVSGLSDLRIIGGHVLPRVAGTVVVQAAVFGANAVVIESALSFLGFGKQPPEATWGNMVAEAADTISLNSWVLYPTGAAIALTALALGVAGDVIRDRAATSWTTSLLTPTGRRRPDGAAPATSAPRPDSETDSLLQVRDLAAGYRTSDGLRQIVDGVSFDVDRGQVVGLVGESGSGKTTVALAVLGTVGAAIEVPHGSVTFDGDELHGLGEKALRSYRGRRIAYVAQEPMVALDPNHRVGDLLTEAIRIHRGHDDPSNGSPRERALELLRDVEIPRPSAVFGMYPHQLSGGMAQRISIAFALAGRPELLVADEPTTALDVTVQAGILGLLRRLQVERGMAILLITHDWGVIADICDDVVVLHRGEVVESGSVERIFAEAEHPYTRSLLAADPHGAEPGQYLPITNNSEDARSAPDSGRAVTAAKEEG